MKLTRGDMYSLSQTGRIAGVNNGTFLYVLLAAGTNGRYRILVLNTPDDWWTNPVWVPLQHRTHPIGKVFGWRGPARGNLSVGTLNKKTWLSAAIIPGLDHTYVGNLIASVATLSVK